MASKGLSANAGFFMYSWDVGTWYDASDYGAGFYFSGLYPGAAENKALLRFGSAGVDNTKITSIVITYTHGFTENSSSISGLSFNIGFSTSKTFVAGTATNIVNIIKPAGGGDVTTYLTWTGKPGISLNSTWYLSFSVKSGTSSGNALMGYLKAITINYSSATACSAPASVFVSTNNVLPGTNVALNWSGAASGTDNAINGYEIYRSTSAGSGYGLLTSVASSATSGAISVTSNAIVGASYYYKIVTKGAAGSAYYSGQSSSYATLTTTINACGAPTVLTVSSTNVRPGTTVTLSWSGATAGLNNGISGFDIYRSTAAGNGYALLISIPSTSTTDSASVLAPTTKSTTYYYRIVTKGTAGTAYHSGQSSSFAALSTAAYGNTVGYLQGGSFIQCEVYYFDGLSWVECIPYYRQGNAWIECNAG